MWVIVRLTAEYRLLTPIRPDETFHFTELFFFPPRSLYRCDAEAWPTHMRLEFEHFEHELPFNRTPLSEQIEQLAKLHQRPQHHQGEEEGAVGGVLGDVPWPPLDASSGGSYDGATTTTASSSIVGCPPVTNLSSRSASGSGSGSLRVSEQGGSTAASSPPGRPGRTKQLHGCFLRNALLSELHPASWFAVAWYPVYRIPDAPLCARFLTFHSFAPLVINMQQQQQECLPTGAVPPPQMQQQQGSPLEGTVPLPPLMQPQQQGGSLSEGAVPLHVSVPLPVSGLKWYNMHGERWFDSVSEKEALRQQQMHYINGGALGGGRRTPHPQDYAWQAHLKELQGNAERLARGQGLRLLHGPMNAEEVRVLRHPDYEFFNSRS